MKTIALTGGIGMGKSTVASLLRASRVSVVDSDDLARDVVQPGQPALDEIRTAFGRHVVSPGGELRREELARIVFADPEARRKLEAITHPRIQELWRAQLSAWKAGGSRFGVVVIPLLFEIGAAPEFDRVICVACSAATQMERLRARGWSAGECQQRLAAQLPVAEKVTRSHHIVWTEGQLAVTASQLTRLFAD